MQHRWQWSCPGAISDMERLDLAGNNTGAHNQGRSQERSMLSALDVDYLPLVKIDQTGSHMRLTQAIAHI